jgi:phenylalanyl-tRNA synthetase beta chain
VVDEGIPAQEIIDALVAVKPPSVDHLALFDVYRGAGIDSGKKSLAILVLIQDTARTLTDAEIDETVAVLLHELQSRFKATLRR